MDNEKTVFKSLVIIEENIREKLTVERLAESLHFSKYHYQRLFREIVGDSVMRYVTKRRLPWAAAELIESEDTILNIALKYGYDSHEGFTRSFRAYMGVTPREYRKYHSSVASPEIRAEKEKSVMPYSKSTNELIRELNGLIVQAKEAVEYLRKNKKSDSETAAYYSDFWDYVADKTDAMAGMLTKSLEPITDAAPPDEITAGFIIIKTIEDTVFQLNLMIFHTELTISRAKPEHRPTLQGLCDKLNTLSHNTMIKSVRIAEYFNKLSSLILSDMRENAKKRIDTAIAKGSEAVKTLKEIPHYSYIAEEIGNITNEISFMPFEEMTAEIFEYMIFRLDIIAFAADMDSFRTPSDKPQLDGIRDFRDQLSETADFFGSLSEDIIYYFGKRNKKGFVERTKRKRYGDPAFQENILLFYLKGEAQKLKPYLSDNQKTAFDRIIEKMNTAIRLANHGSRINGDIAPMVQTEITAVMKDIYSELTAVKEELGDKGSAVGYIAEELKRCSVCRNIAESEGNGWL